tara:strand:- start:4435 stop:4620 length:186 start_codon:yes stop_codon:yes gene_type:complete
MGDPFEKARMCGIAKDNDGASRNMLQFNLPVSRFKDRVREWTTSLETENFALASGQQPLGP